MNKDDITRCDVTLLSEKPQDNLEVRNYKKINQGMMQKSWRNYQRSYTVTPVCWLG